MANRPKWRADTATVLGMSWRFPRVAAALCFIAVLAFASFACGNGNSAHEVPEPAGSNGYERPNFVIVMTDDQEVASLDVMPTVKRQLADKGVTFKNAFASYPLCCPSRATFQTGQYAHNHGVLDNRPPKGGYPAFKPDETMPVWLGRSDYETAHVGKYMNDYKKSDEIPPGWDRWFGMVEPSSRYFELRVNDQGEYTKFGKKDPGDYSTDVFTDRAVEFLKGRVDEDRPFLLSVGYVAPHVARSFQPEGGHCSENGPEPAPRHLGAFDDVQIPRGPSFNENDVTDKPASIRKQPKLRNAELAKKTDKYQCRLETLLSVDEGVSEIIKTLRKTGELDQTYFIYTSDNGFIQGEHRIKGGKAVPYEGAIRIPMLVRGPDVARDENAKELVSNVDVVPTILDLAGVEAGLPTDGRSFESSLRDTGVNEGRAVLIESDHESEVFRGVRTGRYLYVERETGESELYDLRADPNELESIAENPVYSEARASLRATLGRLVDCSGKACSTTPELSVEAVRAPRNGGQEDCRSDRAVVSVAGPDAPFVVGTRLGRPGDLGNPGYAESRTIAVPRARQVELVAIAELADGREKRMKATIEGC